MLEILEEEGAKNHTEIRRGEWACEKLLLEKKKAKDLNKLGELLM